MTNEQEQTPSHQAAITIRPEFVPDQMDLEKLATAYLEEFVSLDSFCFFSGSCEGVTAHRAYDRFEKVAAALGTEVRQEIIDNLDHHRTHIDGDQWHFFKYASGETFWSTPADRQAVFSVAASIPDDMSNEEAGHYGAEFLDAVLAAKHEMRSGEPDSSRSWINEGF